MGFLKISNDYFVEYLKIDTSSIEEEITNLFFHNAFLLTHF
jgi:hypothetical protein